MIKYIGVIITSLIILTSCGGSQSQQTTSVQTTDTLNALESDQDCKSYYRAAAKADSVLMHATSQNIADAENALKAFNSFASFCRKDTLAAIFLVKGGQVAQSIRNFTQAKAMWEQCITNFPQSKNRSVAMFLLAQLYDDVTMLNNEEEAKKLYEQIVKEYPKSALATDAKTCLNNLGKSDEQLVQEFLKKNK